MKTIAKILIVTCFSIFMSGCGGMIADALVRSTSTDKTYAELAPIPAPIDSDGRIYIYRSEDSTKNSLVYGIGLSKNYIYCAVDDQVFCLLWEVFMYKDLPTGVHEVSCGNVLLKTDFWTSQPHFQRGTQKLPVSVQNNKERYVRIDLIEKNPTPVLVDAAIAKEEISKLPLLKTQKPAGRVE